MNLIMSSLLHYLYIYSMLMNEEIISVDGMGPFAFIDVYNFCWMQLCAS